MGLFDLFKAGDKGSRAKATPAAKWAERIDKRAQNYDRQEAITALSQMATADAVEVLLRRFSFHIDPSITDQEEKEVAFQGVIAAGKDCVPAVVDFCGTCIKKGEPITWLLKILHELLEDDEYHDELIDLLGHFDTEYARNVEPKVQVIQALEEVVSPDVREAVAPFLEDVNETVRFHAVQTTFAQNEPACIPGLIKLLEAEESVRVKNKVAEGLLFRAWVIPPELREPAAASLRDASGYHIGGDGKIVKQRGDWH